MNLSRYDEHTTTKHQCDLEKPDFEEFDTARGAFLIDVERINPEDLKTAYWDYDSEAGKRYSEDESGEESNNDDTIKIKKKINQPSGYASSGGSSSSSSSEHSSDSSKKKQKIYRKLPSQKKSSSSVPLNTYNKDREDDSDRMNGKFNEVNQILRKISSDYNVSTKKEQLNEEAVLEMNTNMKSLQAMAKSIFNKSNKLRSTLLDIAKEKSNSINENES